MNGVFYTRYNPPPSPVTVVVGKSLTRQDCKDECDINYILQRVGLGTMSLPPVQPFEVDLTNVPNNYQDMVAAIDDARAQFGRLPSAIRDRFGHDPARLLAFIENAENREEAIKLGLVAKPVEVPAETKSAE